MPPAATLRSFLYQTARSFFPSRHRMPSGALPRQVPGDEIEFAPLPER